MPKKSPAKRAGPRSPKRRRLVAAPLLAVASLLGASCTVETIKSQAVEQRNRISTELQRGVSTKADVLTLLGQPDGSGGAFFPMATHGDDVWYYESLRSSFSRGQQRILLVYFADDKYDGFMWFTNDVATAINMQ